MLRDDYLDMVRLAVRNALFNGVTVEEIIDSANSAIAYASSKRAELDNIIPYPNPPQLAFVTPAEHRQYEDALHKSQRVNMFVVGGRLLYEDMHSEERDYGNYVKFKVEHWDSYERAVYKISDLPPLIAAKINEGHRHFAANVILPAYTSKELHPVRWEFC